MNTDESTQTYANDSATSSPIDTKLAQGRSLSDLIDSYQTDPVSSYHRLRYQTRRNHGNLLARLKVHVKHAATHSDIAQTQHYARGAAAKIATVQSARNLHRGAQYRDKFRNNS